MQAQSSTIPQNVAIVAGREFTKYPDDLFIPPDALEVLLESFSGPLDLLLYLIRKQNIDILDIPIVSITQQYLRYIELMQCRSLELAADYLLMAAVLAEIKSRMLLPVAPNSQDEDEEDPRMVLVRRLQAYEEIKQAAAFIEALPRQDRDHFMVEMNLGEMNAIKQHPEVILTDLFQAMMALVQKEERLAHHEISRETMSVRERMSQILHQLQHHGLLELRELFTLEEGRPGLVVSLLAILELARQFLLVIRQDSNYATVSIRAA